MTLMLNIKHSNMIDVCPDCVQMKYQDKRENNFIFGMPFLKLEKNQNIYLSWSGQLCCSLNWSQVQGAISWTRCNDKKRTSSIWPSTCWEEVRNSPSPHTATRPSSCSPCAPCSSSSRRRTVRILLQIKSVSQFVCFWLKEILIEEAFAVVR